MLKVLCKINFFLCKAIFGISGHKLRFGFSFACMLTYDESKSSWYVKEGPTISITGVVGLIPMSRCKEKIPGRLV